MAVYLRCAGKVAVILHYVTMCKLEVGLGLGLRSGFIAGISGVWQLLFTNNFFLRWSRFALRYVLLLSSTVAYSFVK